MRFPEIAQNFENTITELAKQKGNQTEIVGAIGKFLLANLSKISANNFEIFCNNIEVALKSNNSQYKTDIKNIMSEALQYTDSNLQNIAHHICKANSNKSILLEAVIKKAMDYSGNAAYEIITAYDNNTEAPRELTSNANEKKCLDKYKKEILLQVINNKDSKIDEVAKSLHRLLNWHKVEKQGLQNILNQISTNGHDLSKVLQYTTTEGSNVLHVICKSLDITDKATLLKLVIGNIQDQDILKKCLTAKTKSILNDQPFMPIEYLIAIIGFTTTQDQKAMQYLKAMHQSLNIEVPKSVTKALEKIENVEAVRAALSTTGGATLTAAAQTVQLSRGNVGVDVDANVDVGVQDLTGPRDSVASASRTRTEYRGGGAPQQQGYNPDGKRGEFEAVEIPLDDNENSQISGQYRPDEGATAPSRNAAPLSERRDTSVGMQQTQRLSAQQTRIETTLSNPGNTIEDKLTALGALLNVLKGNDKKVIKATQNFLCNNIAKLSADELEKVYNTGFIQLTKKAQNTDKASEFFLFQDKGGNNIFHLIAKDIGGNSQTLNADRTRSSELIKHIAEYLPGKDKQDRARYLKAMLSAKNKDDNKIPHQVAVDGTGDVYKHKHGIHSVQSNLNHIYGKRGYDLANITAVVDLGLERVSKTWEQFYNEAKSTQQGTLPAPSQGKQKEGGWGRVFLAIGILAGVAAIGLFAVLPVILAPNCSFSRASVRLMEAIIQKGTDMGIGRN